MAEQKEQIIDYRELGQSGLKRMSGFIHEEFVRELCGIKGMAIFKEMMNNDAVVASILFTMKMYCRQVKWRVQPASEQPFDLEAKDFLETCMSDMSQTWIDTIDEILSMLGYGFAPAEIVYKRRAGNVDDPTMRSKHNDGRIGWRKLPLRSQDTIYRWNFDDNGGIKGLEQIAPPHYINTYIPIEKILLFRTSIEKNNPEGKSILRAAYRSWYNKKNIENIEGVGIERDLAGLPVIGAPPEIFSANASQDQKNTLNLLKQIVTNIRRDEQEGVVFPLAYNEGGKPLYELKLLSTGGQRQFDTDKIVKRYDQRIAMSCLADFILLGHEQVGSFALASSKTNAFATALGGFLDIICDVFNRFAIPRLFALNDFVISDFPTICHGDIETPDLTEISKYVQTLAASGMPLFPNPELEKRLMEIANLPYTADEALSQELQVEPTEPDVPGKVTEIFDEPNLMVDNQYPLTNETK